MSLDWLNPTEEASALAYLEGRFGIPPAALADHRLFRRGEHLCALRREAEELAEGLQVASAGLKLLKVTGSGGYKPSTRGMQIFGRAASRNVCEVTEGELRALVEGQSLSREGERGFVLLRCAGALVGVGLLREGLLVSQLSRNVTMHLRFSAPGSGASTKERPAQRGERTP